MTRHHFLPAARFTALVSLLAVLRPDSLVAYGIALVSCCLLLAPDAMLARRAPRPRASQEWRIAAESLEDRAPADDFARGYALLRAGSPADAEPWLRRAVEADAADADARLNLGIALAECGRHAEAIAELEEATRLRPRDASAHHRLGVSCAADGRHFAAVHAFREALRLDPRHAESERALAAVGATLSRDGGEPASHSASARAKRASGSAVRAS
ncbi:MAG TPA: tetratricopeptide repeat protein [Gemmatimonadaceae bacterium]